MSGKKDRSCKPSKMPDEIFCNRKYNSSGNEEKSSGEKKKARFSVQNALNDKTEFEDCDDMISSGERMASFFPSPSTVDINSSKALKTVNKNKVQLSKTVLWKVRTKSGNDGVKDKQKACFTDVVARRRSGAKCTAGIETSGDEAVNENQLSENNTIVKCAFHSDRANPKVSVEQNMKASPLNVLHKKRSGGLDVTKCNGESKGCLLPAEKMSRAQGTTIPGKKNDNKASGAERTIQATEHMTFKDFKRTSNGNAKGSVNKKVEKTREGARKVSQFGASQDSNTAGVMAFSRTAKDDRGFERHKLHPSTSYQTKPSSRRPKGTSAVIDIDQIKLNMHAGCCGDCVQARTSADQDNQSPSANTEVSSSDDPLEDSISFFRSALAAMDLIEELFKNVGNTKAYLKKVYDGLGESSVVSRYRSTVSQDRLTKQATAIKDGVESDKDESTDKKKGDGFSHDEKAKSKVNKTSNKVSRDKATKLSSFQQSKQRPKRGKQIRNKNLLELSEEWQKRSFK